ncbi:hypothetical protein MSG28_012044 [Choristoneura fumiferana]|uniref:Uncharacterized protein n=1 Tax=Choristoneura fumiferana TaxID=7141 RepID=A0ACC0KNU9_CHOFU|nr:hypothetical protein MSG28_012044 [Choristoneura fumiferana]
MQGFKTFVLLAVVVALLGLARAAPADNELTGLEQLEQLPELLMWSSPAALSEAARRCNDNACRLLCRAIGWRNGFCHDGVRCRCSK